jgi:hypothetical protein
VQFEVSTDSVATDVLDRLLARPRRPWYRFLPASRSKVAPFADLRAIGNFRVQTFYLGSLPVFRVRASVEWSSGILHLKQLRAEMWEGQHRGDLSIDLRRPLPSYNWRGELQQVSMTELGRAADLPWEGGRATVRGEGTASGSISSDLLRSMNVSLQIDWRNGLLKNLNLEEEGEPLTLKRFLGKVELRAGTLTIPSATLRLEQGGYEVGGAASRNGDLKFHLLRTLGGSGGIVSAATARGAAAYSITGTLERPVVDAIARPEEASLLSTGTEVQDRADARSKDPRIPLRSGR